jgi:polysaccharide pyruvyl transferase WcaK-like protein
MTTTTNPASSRDQVDNDQHPADSTFDAFKKAGPEHILRIALLTPYTGNNLGDAAILDALIANLRARLPGVLFSGITFNCDNFIERHGSRAFPLCGSDKPFHCMIHPKASPLSKTDDHLVHRPSHAASWLNITLKRVPVIGPLLQAIRAAVRLVYKEIRHGIGGYRFLRTHDLVVVCGGGQLDDEWGGSWGHPFALFKWAVLARLTHVPYAFASVGAGKISTNTSRFFLSKALGMAKYRSYRDRNSRELAIALLEKSTTDAVVPDLAFSLSASQLPLPTDLRSIAGGRKILALSPIAYGKPGVWPHPQRAVYDRYLHQISVLISALLNRNFFLIIVRSALSDEGVIRDLLTILDVDSKPELESQLFVPEITTWKKLVAVLEDVDIVVASRLHSAILSFESNKPTIAISFDSKVDWVMRDLGQTDYLLHIADFSADDVLKAIDRIQYHEALVTQQLRTYRQQALSCSAIQYDALASLATAAHGVRN